MKISRWQFHVRLVTIPAAHTQHWLIKCLYTKWSMTHSTFSSVKFWRYPITASSEWSLSTNSHTTSSNWQYTGRSADASMNGRNGFSSRQPSITYNFWCNEHFFAIFVSFDRSSLAAHFSNTSSSYQLDEAFNIYVRPFLLDNLTWRDEINGRKSTVNLRSRDHNTDNAEWRH